MIRDKVISTITEYFGFGPDEVKEDSNMESLQFDSLDMMELAFSIEDEFDIEIQDEEIEAIKTVADVIKLVEGKVNAIA